MTPCVYAPERWVEDALLRPEVREAYRQLVAQGRTDALRALHPHEQIYTFWKYRNLATGRIAVAKTSGSPGGSAIRAS